jgi:hypothetical protein
MWGWVGLDGRPPSLFISLLSRTKATSHPHPREAIKASPTDHPTSSLPSWRRLMPIGAPCGRPRGDVVYIFSLLPELASNRFGYSSDDPVTDIDYLVLSERLFDAFVGKVVGKRFMTGRNLLASVDVEEFHFGQ